MSALRYLLDTNILSALMRDPQAPVTAILSRRGYDQVCASLIVAAELRLGALKRGSPVLLGKVTNLLVSIDVVVIDSQIAVDQTIPCRDDETPRYLWIGRPDVIGDMRRGLAN